MTTHAISIFLDFFDIYYCSILFAFLYSVFVSPEKYCAHPSSCIRSRQTCNRWTEIGVIDSKKEDGKGHVSCLVSFRNTADPLMKQSSIASISSHVPLLSTSSDADAHHLTQAMVHTNTDVQNFLDSMKTNTSRRSCRFSIDSPEFLFV